MLNRFAILCDEFQNVLLNEPPEEVQLAHGSHEGLHAARLKHDALAAAEGVKQTLAVRIQFTLVVEIDKEGTTTGLKTGIHLLGVIGHEVIHQTQTHRGGALKDRE